MSGCKLAGPTPTVLNDAHWLEQKLRDGGADGHGTAVALPDRNPTSWPKNSVGAREQNFVREPDPEIRAPNDARSAAIPYVSTMPSVAPRRSKSRVMLLAASLSAACMAQPSDEDDLRTDDRDDTSEVNDTGDVTPVGACNLQETSGSPVVTLSGRLCGETVNITTRAGKTVHLGRSSATDPEAEVRIVEVLDSAEPGAPASLRDAEFLLNLAFETGPELADGVSYHNLASGVFSLCGFGTVVFLAVPVTFQFSGVDTSTGDFNLSLTGLLVSGYAEEHGQDRVTQCGGELDVTITGRLRTE